MEAIQIQEILLGSYRSQKEHNMDSTKCDTITDKNVKEVFMELFTMQLSGKYVFRGISHEDHYKPPLIRAAEKHKIPNILKYEEWLLTEFGRYSSQYISNVFTPMDWVASAQHFGLPTRLIDWTFDPFCALYFALINPIKEDEGEYCLLIVNHHEHLYFEKLPLFKSDNSDVVHSNIPFIDQYINSVNGIADLNYKLLKSYSPKSPESIIKNRFDKARNKEYDNPKIHHLVFCSVYDTNPRIIAQRGLFQIPRRFNYDSDSIFSNKTYTINGCEKIYKINAESRIIILEMLKRINITTPRLFPDLQSICDYIKLEDLPEYNIFI